MWPLFGSSRTSLLIRAGFGNKRQDLILPIHRSLNTTPFPDRWRQSHNLAALELAVPLSHIIITINRFVAVVVVDVVSVSSQQALPRKFWVSI